ncbi:aldo/keto reductase, partial [Escherichia coli]|nr:aldo/keto reductase [Escherichia coli]
RPGRMEEDLAALNAPVPAEFWAEMCRQNLVAENAPLPTR